MPTHLRLTVTFLDSVPAFHGRGDGGEPEWPPSPLRVYQSLVAAAAARLRPQNLEAAAGEAFRWLEALPPPQIVCPPAHHGLPVRTAVPNNDLDVWAKDLARRVVPDKQPSELKTLKTVRPVWLRGGSAVQYVWQLGSAGPSDGVIHTLRELAHHITHLGWGVNQAVGHFELLDAEPPANPPTEKWEPTGGDAVLRVPRAGTFADLCARHRASLRRIEEAGFDSTPQLSEFVQVGYQKASDPAGRPWAAFELLNPDTDEGGRVSFDTARRAREVAAMVRHAVGRVCQGWPADFGSLERFVHGHDGPDRPSKGDGADQRFQYLPLPTINPLRVESIRRVLVVAPSGCERQVEWVRQRLSGQPLERLPDVSQGSADRVVGLLSGLPADDWVRRQYTGSSAMWSTVTPVLLPGYDDRDPRRAERLVWKAFADAGLAPEALAGATADWRAVGFRAGVEPAWRFDPPAEGRHWPRYHVRVRFAHAVAGPLTAGAGRYRGFGLFAAD